MRNSPGNVLSEVHGAGIPQINASLLGKEGILDNHASYIPHRKLICFCDCVGVAIAEAFYSTEIVGAAV